MFLTNGAGKTSAHKRTNLEPYFTPYTKINSKLMHTQDQNIRAKTIKLLENIGVNFCDPELGNSF